MFRVHLANLMERQIGLLLSYITFHNRLDRHVLYCAQVSGPGQLKNPFWLFWTMSPGWKGKVVVVVVAVHPKVLHAVVVVVVVGGFLLLSFTKAASKLVAPFLWAPPPSSKGGLGKTFSRERERTSFCLFSFLLLPRQLFAL